MLLFHAKIKMLWAENQANKNVGITLETQDKESKW